MPESTSRAAPLPLHRAASAVPSEAMRTPLRRHSSASGVNDPRQEIHGLPSRILRAATIEDLSEDVQPPEGTVALIRTAVAGVELFNTADMSLEHVDAVCRAFRPVPFEADAVVYAQGTLASCFYVVASGEFEGVSPDLLGEGSRQTYPTGGCFGDEALLGGCERPQSVRCLTAGVVWALEAAAFRRIIAENMAAMQRRTASMGSQLQLSGCSAHAPPSHIGTIDMRQLVAEGWLGDGAFGVVWRVRHEPSATLFALKCMERGRLRTPQDADGVLRERHILGLLSQPEHAHSLIVRATAFFQDVQGLYMLLELISGGDLKAKLERVRTLSPSCSAFYAACTSAALMHLHSLGVVYRDLKPENLVIDHAGYLKLIDFGLSKVLATDGRTWTLCGTPHFMAPEVVRGRGYGLPADWWALGILVFEMLTGGCPFEGDTQVDIFKRIMATPRVVAYPADMPGDAVSFIQQLLVGAPTRRLAGVDCHAHPFVSAFELTALLSGQLTPPNVVSTSVLHGAQSGGGGAEGGAPSDAPAAASECSSKTPSGNAPTDEEASSSASGSSDDEKEAGAAKASSGSHASAGGRAAVPSHTRDVSDPPELPSWADFEPWCDLDDPFYGFASDKPTTCCPVLS